MAGEAWAMLETDLAATLESDFAAPITLVDPDGNFINYSAHGGPLLGKVQYDTVEVNPGSGEPVAVRKPMVILRTSSLARVPKGGERWMVTTPTSPSDPTPKNFMFDGATHAPKVNGTIGFIILYLQAVGQS
jgi:hypothetical protein